MLPFLFHEDHALRERTVRVASGGGTFTVVFVTGRLTLGSVNMSALNVFEPPFNATSQRRRR